MTLSREGADSRSHVAIRDTHWPSPEPAASPWLQAPNKRPFLSCPFCLSEASHCVFNPTDHRRAKGHRTYSGQVLPSSVLLRAQEQQHSRSELARPPCISALSLTSGSYLRGKSRLEQCVPQSKMERTSSNPTLPTMALGRCRSKPKQSSAGGLDMHAGLCSRSTQCGTVWPRLVHGRG